MKYELVIGTKGRVSFVPDDLRYFNDHFICERMAYDWEIPPAKMIGKSGKTADFVSWMLRAPVISEKARKCLAETCGELVEFLPFHSIKNQKYYVMNVLNRDMSRPVFKTDKSSVVYVDEIFGSIIRDNFLTGVHLADPDSDIGRKIVRGESVNCFPGILG